MNWLRFRPSTGLSGSIATHIAALTILVLLARLQPRMKRVVDLPGTAQGTQVMLTYTLGGEPQHTPNDTLSTAPRKPARPTSPSPKLAAPTPSKHSEFSDPGPGLSGDNASGDEDITVALPQVHPRPQPDLSSLPHGVAGDVIVDIVIDATGKVTQTTLVKGLGGSVDETVMAALRGWIFTPATRNGQVVASEQEVLIHYEHG